MFGRLIAVLTLVIGLILLVTWVLRRTGIGNGLQKSGGKNKRLSIIEVRPVDNQRRLVLIERDSVQHLLLIGGNHDLLVESHIDPDKNAKTSQPDDPLERVRFRDVLPNAKHPNTRIIRPGERLDPSEDDL